MSGVVHGDGLTFESGLRIDGKHCGRCGRPSDAQDKIGWRHTSGGTEAFTEQRAQSACCCWSLCYGYVTTDDWISKAHPEKAVWACHLALAEQHLGEQAWLRSVAS